MTGFYIKCSSVLKWVSLQNVEPIATFIRGKLGTSKIDCGDKMFKKAMFIYILRRELGFDF